MIGRAGCLSPGRMSARHILTPDRVDREGAERGCRHEAYDNAMRKEVVVQKDRDGVFVLSIRSLE